MAIDPVCGMNVDAAEAAGSHVDAGVTHLFCSTNCMDAFKSDPDRYVGGERAKPKKTGANLAKDPICGMLVDKTTALKIMALAPSHTRQKVDLRQIATYRAGA